MQITYLIRKSLTATAVAAMLTFSFVACDNDTPAEDAAEEHADDMEDANDGIDDNDAVVVDTDRGTYITEHRNEWTTWNSDLDRWEANVEAESREEWNDFRNDMREFEADLNAAGNAAESEWDGMKADLDREWNELKTRYDTYRGRYDKD